MALTDDQEKELKATHEKAIKELSEKIAALEKKPDPKPDPKPDEKKKEDLDLSEKARKEKEDSTKRAEETRRLENAVTFNLSVKEFLKSNMDLMPSEVEEIIKQAEKETFDSAFEKSSAVKSGLIQTFFNVQSNLDLLTPNQKAHIDNFFKLTKNGKEQRSEFIWENIFEPCFETLKKIKKAEELARSNAGYASGSKTENAYKEKLMSVSRKAHLGEK